MASTLEKAKQNPDSMKAKILTAARRLFGEYGFYTTYAYGLVFILPATVNNQSNNAKRGSTPQSPEFHKIWQRRDAGALGAGAGSRVSR